MDVTRLQRLLWGGGTVPSFVASDLHGGATYGRREEKKRLSSKPRLLLLYYVRRFSLVRQNIITLTHPKQ